MVRAESRRELQGPGDRVASLAAAPMHHPSFCPHQAVGTCPSEQGRTESPQLPSVLHCQPSGVLPKAGLTWHAHPGCDLRPAAESRGRTDKEQSHSRRHSQRHPPQRHPRDPGMRQRHLRDTDMPRGAPQRPQKHLRDSATRMPGGRVWTCLQVCFCAHVW